MKSFTEFKDEYLSKYFQDQIYVKTVRHFNLDLLSTFLIEEFAYCLLRIAYERKINRLPPNFQAVLPYARRYAITLLLNNITKQYMPTHIKTRINDKFILYNMDLIYNSIPVTVEPITRISKRVVPIFFHLDRIGWILAKIELDFGYLMYFQSDFLNHPLIFKISTTPAWRENSKEVLQERFSELAAFGMESHYEPSNLCKTCLYSLNCPSPPESRKGVPKNHFKINWELDDKLSTKFYDLISAYLLRREYSPNNLCQIFYCPRQTYSYQSRQIHNYLKYDSKRVFYNFYRRAMFEFVLQEYPSHRAILLDPTDSMSMQEQYYEMTYYITPTGLNFVPIVYDWYDRVPDFAELNLTYLLSKIINDEVYLVYFPLQNDEVRVYFLREGVITSQIYEDAYAQMRLIKQDVPKPSPRCHNCFVLKRCPEGREFVRSAFGKKLFKTDSLIKG